MITYVIKSLVHERIWYSDTLALESGNLNMLKQKFSLLKYNK